MVSKKDCGFFKNKEKWNIRTLGNIRHGTLITLIFLSKTEKNDQKKKTLFLMFQMFQTKKKKKTIDFIDLEKKKSGTLEKKLMFHNVPKRF